MFMKNDKGEAVVNKTYLNGIISGVWTQFDEDNNGYLSRNELQYFMAQMMQTADIEAVNELDQETLDDMFDRIDISADGTISKEELTKFLEDMFL